MSIMQTRFWSSEILYANRCLR